MSHFDVFNGDADGLCALHQLRLAEPREAELITGMKRENALLSRVVAAAGDSVTVLDISLEPNREALLALLARGVGIEYFDHHRSGPIPGHQGLKAVIDPAPDVCTSILVDRHLAGRHRPWAVVGAFGDAQAGAASMLAASLSLGRDAISHLQHLGECLNYNSYGDSPEDQMISPLALYRLLVPYPDPLAFLAREPVCGQLSRQYADDLKQALVVPPLATEAGAAIFQLPDAPWARRIVGPLANRLAAAVPTRAYAVLVPNRHGSFTASLRVPRGTPMGADRFAARYGGSGRVTAAGINNLPTPGVAGLAADFLAAYRSPAR